MISAFERMTQSILAVLGEDALFDGVVPCKINIEHDVQFAGIDHEAAQYRGDITIAKDVATIANTVNPVLGKTFQMAVSPGVYTGQRYRLDKYVDQNGYSKRFVVLKVA